MSEHARISPSSLHRKMLCPGSDVLEFGEPDTESEYSKEGNVAHALAAQCLKKGINANTILSIIYQGEKTLIPPDMVTPTQEYIDFVRSKKQDGSLFIEEKLELEWLTGEKGAKGTVDAQILSKDGTTLHTLDLKFGMGVKVSVEDNPQMLAYTAMANRQVDMIASPTKFINTIVQPRLSHVDTTELTLGQLKAFEDKVRATVKRVEEARKSNSLEGFLNPGEEQCRFCKGRYKCPALASMVSTETGADFDDVSQQTLLAPIDAHKAMLKADLIEIWIKGLRQKVEADLFSGQKSKYWKLVEGKRGGRKWVDEKAAEDHMKALKIPEDDMYDRSLLSVAQLEKKLKKKPEIFDKLRSLFSQKKGEPSVAPISDPRPAYDVNHAEDFEEVT